MIGVYQVVTACKELDNKGTTTQANVEKGLTALHLR